MRAQVTRDIVYETLDEECRAIIAGLGGLPFEGIVQTLGVLKKVTNSF